VLEERAGDNVRDQPGLGDEQERRESADDDR
jgi:hypothetical protein